MDPVDRILYQGLVDSVSKSLISRLPQWVFGWRLKRSEPESGQYSRNDYEWDNQRSKLKRLVSLREYGLKTDIVSCFASMPVERVCEEIERRSGTGKIPERLISMLQPWDSMPNRHGIPQRSMASAVIANMYMAPLDQCIDEFNAEHTISSRFRPLDSLSTRWMDDIWIFSNNDAQLRGLQIELQKVARQYELELNASKTNVYEGDELANQALKINHSAVEEGLSGDEIDLEPLEDLLDEIVDNPEETERPSIHFAMVRMRQQGLKTRLADIRDVAHRVPHGADHFARAFRDLGSWQDLQDWYLDYLDGDWACFEWSSAQLGTMFPARAKIDASLISRFESIANDRPGLPMAALTLQRLCKWKPASVKELVRALRDHADHPLERRLLALAALAVKDERRIVRELLSGYEENAVTLAMIEAASFKPIAVAADFEGRGDEARSA